MKTPPKPLAVFKTDAFKAEPMSLATGSPRYSGCATKSNMDRRAAPGSSARGSGFRGFTLIEAMIAITMTLIIMLALAQGFKRLSDDISQGRARLALSDQLRSVSEVLRNDLASLTVDPDPTTPNNKLGYFMYYDGPVTDYTAATLPINTVATGTTEQRLSASKYGDFDDILMFTAKAKGDLFKGRVPLAIVKGAAAAQSGAPYTPSQSDWVNSVVLASEFAEIAYFMVPMNVDESSGEAEFAIPQIDSATGSLLFEDRDLPVNPTATFNVPSGRALLPNGVGNGVPDRMILCRRVLLIIPSLNVSLSTAPVVQGLTFTDSSPSTRSPFRCLVPTLGPYAMSDAYQGSDLSVRPARTVSGSGALPNGLVPLTANSVEDLANPANRFAHTMLTFPATTPPPVNTTLPILALTPAIPIQEHALRKNSATNNAGVPQFLATNSVLLRSRPANTFLDYGSDPSFSETGFMSPTFLRRQRAFVDDDNDPTTPAVPGYLGLDFSESLATNCVAFDLKGFDASARLLYHAGADGIVGAGGNPSTFGVSGTDDLVLSPSDPGYDESIRYLVDVDGSNPATPPSTWLPTGNQTIANLTASTAVPILTTPLSGRDVTGVTSGSLRRSGRALNAGGINYNIYQPCFDSFTDAFENDGFNQFNATAGTTFLRGRDYLQGTSPPTTLPAGADLAVNGLDDALVDVATAANGIVDDIDERDTSPPINFAMPAIQATIRLEDKQAGVIQQIAVTQSLVNP
jgi:type II secretory pathway pseudopilin PulG